MDWRRAKTIFILVLIGLNLFLLSALAYGGNVDVSKAYNEKAKKILDDRGIVFSGTWPTISAKARQVMFDIQDLPMDKIQDRLMPDATLFREVAGVKEFRSGTRVLMTHVVSATGYPEAIYTDAGAGLQIDRTNEKRQEAAMKQLFRNFGLASYKLEKDVMFTGDTLHYIQPFEKGFLYDNEVIVTLKGNGITQIIFSLFPAKKMQSDTDAGEEMLSVQQAILLSGFQGPAQITAIDFGWGQADKGELYFSPLWRLQLSEGQTVRLNAVNGNLLDR